MTSTNFTLILFITFLGYVYPKLMFVSEVWRHGPRTPSVVYNLTVEPYEDVGDKDKLQHFLIGAEVRRRYVLSEPLISSNYKNSEVFFRATNTKHAIESLECQLLGLYPQQKWESKLNSHQQKKALPPFKFDGLDNILEELGDNSLPDWAVVPPIFSRNRLYDFKLGIHDSNCTGFKQLKLDLMNSAEYAQLQKPYTDLLLPIFTSEHVLKYICRDSQTHQWNSSNITDLDIHNIALNILFKKFRIVYIEICSTNQYYFIFIN